MIDAVAVGLETVCYGAALLASGLVFAEATLLLAPAAREPELGTRTVARIAAALVVAVACVNDWLLHVRLGGTWDVEGLSATLASPNGAAFALQVTGGVWLLTSARAAMVPALLVIAAFAVSGHAGARGWLTAGLLWVHLIAAAWWIGGLVVLWRTCRVALPSVVSTRVARFGAQAVWVVGVLIAAGTIEAGLLLDFQVDLTRDYERTLGVKLGLVLVLMALAGCNRWILTPALLRTPAQSSPLVTSVHLELALIAAILTTTAVLTVHVGLHPRAEVAARVVAVVDGLAIADPWATVTPPVVKQSAGYLTLDNRSDQADRLIAARSPRGRVSLHAVNADGGVARMRPVAAFDVPALARTQLTSGVAHLMFEDVDPAFEDGEWVDVTLVFERRGAVDVLFPVQRDGATHGAH